MFEYPTGRLGHDFHAIPLPSGTLVPLSRPRNCFYLVNVGGGGGVVIRRDHQD